jgi:hypothetical protein
MRSQGSPGLESDVKLRSRRRLVSLTLLGVVAVTILAAGSILATVTGTFEGLGTHRQSARTTSTPTPGAPAPMVAPPTEPIPPGQVAVKLPLPSDDHLAVAGTVSPGDYITVKAILSTGLFGSKDPTSVTRLVFDGVQVIRVDRPEPDSPKQGSLVVWMWACDVRYIAWLAHNAELTYTLLAFAPNYQTLVGSDVQRGCDPSAALPAAVDARWKISGPA